MTFARPVVVGLGRRVHLALREGKGPTYCGREWTADVSDRVNPDCPSCLQAYANGRHPRVARTR